ncbi:ribonuclease P protein component [uncultured Actinomyces sp.]|uniref:ribonuclease P protein component n=1 Tax=uncultured Actinomyces sp. TaxID=249061 RepID=UPI002603F329|nr:ribonuclease P protein component [uncultured Actinomyces sp.]
MLSAQNRLRDPELFRKVFRFGKRAGNRKLVVHVLTGEVPQNECLVGFVVPKKVFARAVARNKVKRQLRHICRDRVQALPPHTILVIRVLEGCRGSDYHELEEAVDDALSRALARSGK